MKSPALATEQTRKEYTPKKALTDLYVAADIYVSRIIFNLMRAHKIGTDRPSVTPNSPQDADPKSHINHLIDHFQQGTVSQGRRLRRMLGGWLQALRETDREGRNVLHDEFVERHCRELPTGVQDHLTDRLAEAQDALEIRMMQIASSHEREPTLDDLARAIEPLSKQAVADE